MRRLPVILICAVSLILLTPVWIILFALVYREDRLSPILKQERIGKDQVPFNCYKIRTMKGETETVASHHASYEGVTKIGRVLRHTGLDELPQIANVLFGTMNIVGPRPCLPSQTDVIAERAAHGVYSVLPGITGLAQVRGVDMSDAQRVTKIDLEYVQNRTLWLDIQIIWATARGKGAGDAIKP